MRQHFLIIVFLIIGICVHAQQEIAVAERKYESYSFKPAQDIYERLLAHGVVNAELLKKLGNTYYFNAEYDKAAEKYARLLLEFEGEMDAPFYFRYAQALLSSGQPDLAAEMRSRFTALTKGTADKRVNFFENSLEFQAEIESNSGRFESQSFSHNSEYSDFAPAFYKSGLLFASDRDTGNLARYRHTWNQHDFLDLFSVNNISDASKPAEKFSPLNSRFHESTLVFSKDGKTVYFTRSGPENGGKKKVAQLKIYRAKEVSGIWSEPESLSINSEFYSVANPALSPDERTLYFASDMPGGFGESDLWMVAIRSDGTLGKPNNLGSNINTASRETFPYITSEGILYFASDGHPGLGGLDVFATQIANLQHGGKILNVGSPVNSSQDDFTFIIDDESHSGYVASNREGGLGKDDIYAFKETIPLSFKCVQIISGTVRNKITNEVLAGATVRVINEENQEVGLAITDAKGNYTIERDCSQGSFIRATRDGFIASEEYLVPSGGKPRTIDFYLEPDTIYAGFGDDLAKLFQLSTIYFDFNRWDIRPDAEIEILKIIAAMEKYPSLKVKVNSHTDSRGNDAYNLRLSQQRANATRDYMISKGIAADRLTGEGYGETQLINSCSNGVRCSDLEHELNRRSEFIIQE
ncbi:MAG: hypothetical protein RLZZ241_366 [Bacteroidota bacterium]|jgi:outer membrane protein OmpA-like peptidoglycan-associated protein/tetratricopeptide (TPR) repeat protein